MNQLNVNDAILHYQLEEKLGEGGMGVVFRARDVKLNRQVALKFLLPSVSRNPDEREKLITEARAAASLNHPNVATVHAIEEVDDEIFIAMEFIDGEDLSKLLRDTAAPMPISRAAGFVMQIADGLAKAHEAGIIHRDIKPSNIMVLPGDHVKITDFGLAVALDDDSERLGRRQGTLSYMSPEQARGTRVDQRTDIWAVGVLFYELLTGKSPFQGEYEQAIIYALTNEDPLPLQQLVPDIDERYAEIVNTCLEKDPALRYRDISDMHSALQFQPGEVSTAASEQTEPALTKLAVMPFSNLSADSDQEYFCDGITEELITSLSQVSQLRVVSRSSVFSLKGQQLSAGEIGKKLGAQHIIEGSVRKAGKQIRISAQLTKTSEESPTWSNRYDRELTDIFAIQDDITARIVEEIRVELDDKRAATPSRRSVPNLEAHNLYLLARFHFNKRTIEGLHKCIEYCDQALALDPHYAEAYSARADGYILLGFQGALAPIEAFPLARDAADQALANNSKLSEAQTSLGCLRAVFDRDWEGSEKAFRQAIASSPSSAAAHYWFAIWNLMPRRRLEECAEHIRIAQNLDPLSLVLNAGLGWHYYFAQDYAAAEAALARTLELDSNFVFALDVLAQVYQQLGDIERAINLFEQAVDLSDRRSISLAGLANACASAEKTDEANAILEELLDRQQRRYMSAFDIALVYAGLRDELKTLKWLEKSEAEHSGWIAFAPIEPRLQHLQALPEMQALQHRLGL